MCHLVSVFLSLLALVMTWTVMTSTELSGSYVDGLLHLDSPMFYG